MNRIDRRSFLAATATASLPLFARPRAAPARPQAPGGGPVVISSANGLRAIERAMELLRGGADPAHAVVGGVTLVEDDPNVMSVGYGGLPNEDGVVQLDASVMHGPSHKAGAVAALENIRNPARVALEVLRRTDHVLLVGEGAKRFALRLGFEEQDLLTPQSRAAWRRWKRNLNGQDDWLGDDQIVPMPGSGPAPDVSGLPPAPRTHGTIHCAAVDANADLGACTTTSGLSYKLPGRVGDSPIIGAGMYVENDVGAAGATGRGEALMQSCGSFQIVQRMARGDDPTEACLFVLRWIARHTRRAALRNDRGEPNFSATLYALRKDGAYGSATLRGSGKFAVHDGTKSRHEPCAALYG